MSGRDFFSLAKVQYLLMAQNYKMAFRQTWIITLKT
jgi:hypothetical protein